MQTSLKEIVFKFCLLSFILAALSTVALADTFYKTKVTGKITHVSLISDTEKIGKFVVNVAFSSHKCRATIKGEEIPCKISHQPSVDKEGLLCFSEFKIVLNLPAIVKKSCPREFGEQADQRCEELLTLIRNCHPNYFEISYRKVRVMGLNDQSSVNILQIDTQDRDEAFHVLSKVRWPEQK